MKYSDEFKKLINNELQNPTYIGLGNPNAKILIVGKEVSINPNSVEEIHQLGIKFYKNNIHDWMLNIQNNIDQKDVTEWLPEKKESNPLYFLKGEIKKNVSYTWKNYEKLHEIIYFEKLIPDNLRILEFQKDFFITEMSNFPSKTTHIAQQNKKFKEELEKRKNTFFRSEFIQNFPVVVLACSNYIWNKDNDWQINDIFRVTYDFDKKYSKGVYEFSEKNRFWTHYSENGEKLVIHTRQLSNNVKNDMLTEMGTLIKHHLAKLNQYNKNANM